MHARAQELKGYLRKGIRLDELWRVAHGEVKYNEFASTQQNGAAAVAAPAPPSVPDELVQHPGSGSWGGCCRLCFSWKRRLCCC
jgi:hypothetical protein